MARIYGGILGPAGLPDDPRCAAGFTAATRESILWTAWLSLLRVRRHRTWSSAGSPDRIVEEFGQRPRDRRTGRPRSGKSEEDKRSDERLAGSTVESATKLSYAE